MNDLPRRALAGMVGLASIAAAPVSSHFTVEPLAPGVWAAIPTDSGYAVANAGIVDLGDATLVFDPFISPEPAEELREAAERLTGRQARYVALSHWHNDHVRGAQVFSGATIVGSVRTRELILEREPAEVAEEKEVVGERLERARERLAAETDPERRRERLFWVSYYEAMRRSHPLLRPTPPTLAFEGRLTLHGRARSVELRELKGHTASDVVLWLPSERVAFMGDLLFVDRHPWLSDGDPEAHRRTLRAVKALGPERLVPGHGPVRGPESLDALVGYIDTLEALGRALMRAGATDEDAAKAALPASYERWWFGSFYAPNVRFMLRRARGTAPPG